MTDMAAARPAMAKEGARRRLVWLDVARGVALVAMAIYHFGWDLEFFGYLAPGVASTGLWKLFARSIASSFLFLAGFSLVLGHYPVIRWRPFLRRFAMIVAAALLITVATYFATPESFIFYGILHSIAVASLVGLLFLRLPPWLTALCGIAAIAAPSYLRSAFFDTPALSWVGLSTVNPHSNDYVPFFPWFGPALFGIAAARLAKDRGWLNLLAMEDEPAAARWMAWAGRRSLIIYLIHQPILIALVYLGALVYPPAAADPAVAYEMSCVRTCTSGQSQAFCERFCPCTREGLNDGGLFDDLLAGSLDLNGPEARGIADQCAAQVLGGQ